MATATEVETSGIDVKTAVRLAMEYVNELFKPSRGHGPRLEEVEISEDDSTWYVTLSFLREEQPNTISELALKGLVPDEIGLSKFTKRFIREYKRVEIDTKSGAVNSVKIRQL